MQKSMMHGKAFLYQYSRTCTDKNQNKFWINLILFFFLFRSLLSQDDEQAAGRVSSCIWMLNLS